MSPTAPPSLCLAGRVLDRLIGRHTCPSCLQSRRLREMVGVGGLKALVRFHQAWALDHTQLQGALCWDCYSARWNALEKARVKRARACFREVLDVHQDRVAVWDVETAQLGAGIIEVAVVTQNGHVFQRLVRPSVEMHADAGAIHGIAPAELLDAPSWAQVSMELRDWLDREGIRALASWGDYEVRLLTWEQERDDACRRLGVTHLDLMALYDPFVVRPPLTLRTRSKSYPRHRRLKDAAERFGVELDPDQHHRAEYDCKVTWLVMMAMRGQATAPVHVVFPDGAEQ